MKFIFALLVSVALAACGGHHHSRAKLAYGGGNVKEYRVQQSDNSWMYWYVLYSSMDHQTSVYYYRSSTPLTSYSSASFTRAAGNQLPDEVASEVGRGQEVGEQQLNEQELPGSVEQDVAAQQEAYSEYEATQNAADSESSAPPSDSSPSSDSSSSDSSSSSD